MSMLQPKPRGRAQPSQPAVEAQRAAPTRTPGRGEEYRDFHDLLRDFSEVDAPATDDVLAACLPLMRQTADAHDRGKVAPLDGLEALQAFRGRLYFEDRHARAPSINTLAIANAQDMRGALDVGGAYAGRPDARAWRPPEADAAPIYGPNDAIGRPGFLIGYRCWEHAVGSHDPLTDIFSLGLIAASLATGLDLTERADVERLAAHRRRLTALNPRLHPVAAQTIEAMIALDRRRRAQDLGGAIAQLENHRRIAAAREREDAAKAQAAQATTREEAILLELRGRLYDLSRRNKLLHHKPSNAELNLTEASTPIVLRPESIRPEQLLTWRDDVALRFAEQETIALSEFVRFDETVYAPTVLDKLRAQARKDRTEFGASQLRLVAAFLRWRNLKGDPETPISSPLLLVSVDLKKRRGVRDSFELTATSTKAETNPTLRRFLKLLYDVDLPEEVALDDPRAIDDLRQSLAAQLERTEPGVTLSVRRAPDVRALHGRTQKRVDAFRKRQNPAHRGLKQFGDLDYTYASSGWRPLGAQLFAKWVAPARLPQALDGASGRADGASQIALPLDETAFRQAAAAHAAQAPASDPKAFEIDLCAVTLANFNTRKMSLLRDFDALLDGALDRTRGSFDALFSEGPRPFAPEIVAPPPSRRAEVVPADPTQAAAVAFAATGQSLVIQGPPGAGKSQTIANLVADCVARGQRVLFVCEKRAALDVVYHRLEALGLHSLCARVHDSQDDKRSFVHDLKTLYETWVSTAPSAAARQSHATLAERVDRALEELEAIEADLDAEIDGQSLRALAARSAASRTAGAAERVSAADAEGLPTLAEWREGREAAMAMATALRRAGAEEILARHPARFVSVEASSDPKLFEKLSAALDAAGPHLARMSESSDLAVWPSDGGPPPLGALFAQIDCAHRLTPLADAGKLDLLQPNSLEAEHCRRDAHEVALAREALARAQEKTVIWREKLSPAEAEAGLRIAEQHEGSMLGFMSSAWRTTRAEVAKMTGLADMKIKPRIADLLEQLCDEHEAAYKLESELKDLGARRGLAMGEEALALAAERDAGAPLEGRLATPLFDLLAREGKDAAAQVRGLAALKTAADAARSAFDDCFEGLDTLPISRAFAALSALSAAKDALPAVAPALRALSGAPDGVRAALRRIDATVEDLETAVVDRAVERALAVRPKLRETSGVAVDDAAATLATDLDALRKLNAERLLDDARARFVEHVRLASKLGEDAELDAERQVERRAYKRAREELERELSKSQRFRSVRELLSGPAGLLIRDLKPIWLMSPLSVADVLPLDGAGFDVAVFDEASQVPVEDALPTLVRAPQAIVVGDEKQLPPTNFFGRGGGDAEGEADSDEADLAQARAGDAFDPDALADDAPAPLDLDADSFLAQATKTLPATLLGWHYRSRSEELIAFSNAIFYAGRLVTAPSVQLTESRPAIAVGEADAGADLSEEVEARPISFHHTPFAQYERQRNAGEAGYVAQLVRGLLKKNRPKGARPPSIGVVAFSEAQQTEIERALEALAKDDAKFRDLLEKEMEREEDGQFAGLFVKNLENVQGDERDIIIVSVCYAPDAKGRMRMNFGPINRAGGERRLNVIFSRAKAHLALVSTIKADAILNDYNTGALTLKTYLRYADAASRGDAEAMRRALSLVAPHATAEIGVRLNPLADAIAAGLRERGVAAETNLGESAFVIDVAARRGDDAQHRVAILLDGAESGGAGPVDTLERRVVRPRVLNAIGWTTLTVLALDWRRDPASVLDRIERALET